MKKEEKLRKGKKTKEMRRKLKKKKKIRKGKKN